MKRTSQALRRFGVPVLAAMSLLTGGQIALGTTAFAAAGDLTIAPVVPDNGFGSVTPNTAGDDTISYKITYSGAQLTAQNLTVAVSGSAIISAGGGANPVTPAAGGKSATCATPVSPNQFCTFDVTDTVSEAVTITGTDQTDTAAGPASATASYAALYWTNCSQTAPNTAGTCVTQNSVGQSTTYTVSYKTNGSAAAGVTVTFATSHAIVTASQPSGTALVTTSQATCTTNAQGQCSVTILDNTAEASTITATTSNSGNYPSSKAVMTVNVLASAAPGRLVQQGGDVQLQPGTQVGGNNMPGDVVEKTYKLTSCGATTGNNICAEGTALAGVSVSVALDHGFFTPACTSANGAVTNYANCTFNTTPAAGTKVGDIKSSGTSQTVTTASDGTFTVFEGMAKDAGFDDDGNVATTLTATANGTTLTDTNAGVSPSGTTCAAATPGCPKTTAWTTNAAPLNGGSVSMAWVTTPALSSTATNEIQIGGTTEQNILVLNLTDQFGNLTSGGGAAVSLTGTGSGRLFSCASYTSTAPCTGIANGAFTQPSGTPTYTIAANGSYTQTFSAGGATTQNRYGVDSLGAIPQGMQTLKASWNAPISTFTTFVAGTSTTPAVASYGNPTPTAVTASVTNDFYKPVATNVTFGTTPSNSVPAGTVVTVSATVKDQHAIGMNNLPVQFVRSGPQTSSGTSCTATNSNGIATNTAGQAGFSFTCTNPSTQVVTIIVQDNSGNELARGTQTIHFTGITPPPAKKAIHASIHCSSPKKHVLRCKVTETPAFRGLSVTFHSGSATWGTVRTNSSGVAVLTKSGLKSHKVYRVSARVAGSGKTKPATTGTTSARVK